MAFDLLVAPLTCPQCGDGADPAYVQTTLHEAPEGRYIRPGDPLPLHRLNEPSDHLYVRDQEVGEPLHVLELFNCACPFGFGWVDVVVDGGILTEMRAVPQTGAQLRRFHFVSDEVNVFSVGLSGESIFVVQDGVKRPRDGWLERLAQQLDDAATPSG